MARLHLRLRLRLSPTPHLVMASQEQLSEKGKLTMISGSFYIPKGIASRPQGDDAHFICPEKQTIGVADGVGGNIRYGIDPGEYSRELMDNAEKAVQTEPQDNVEPLRVLTKAHEETKAEGSSTACIITLRNNQLHAVNMGDSGFLVISEGEDTYKSPIQQHSFNRPYQLERKTSNLSDAQVIEIPVKAGDVLVAATDGLLDNLFVSQIEQIVKIYAEGGLDPQEIARALAEHAYYNSLDKNASTPFQQASVEANVPQLGGKQDDITVIVSYIVDG